MTLLERVQQQYEILPYPHRDPERELDQLLQTNMSSLPRVNAMLWGGRRFYDGTFRVLDAGCGTGDSTVYLGEQLRGTGAEVVALDFSSTSLGIARRRAEQRGLEGIQFVQASLEDAPDLGLGEFDFVVCSGVLHHLASPDAGLRALRAVLKQDGAMAVMVYATYGREPVYLMQALMRHLAPPELSPERRLRILRRTLESLPAESRTRRALLEHEGFRSEILQSDAGAYDLLLHTQDRPYTVPEIVEWTAGAGMRLLEWTVPRAYDPRHYLPEMTFDHMDDVEQWAAAELMHGGMRKHEFYVERDDAPARPVVRPDALEAVPAWTTWKYEEQVAQVLDTPGDEFRCTFGEERNVVVRGDALGRWFLGAIDGERCVGEILDEAGRRFPAVTRAQARKRWVEFCQRFLAVAGLALNLPADDGLMRRAA